MEPVVRMESCRMRWAKVELPSSLLAHYTHHLRLSSQAKAAVALCRAMARGRAWQGLEAAALVVRPAAGRPLMALVGSFSDAALPRLERLQAQLQITLRHLQYLDTVAAMLLCKQLTDRLLGLVPRADLGQWRFQAIPHGGLFVLEMLAELLDLPPAARQPGPGSPRLVLVDDCALTGSRLRQALAETAAQEVIFLHLASHPTLRGLALREEPRLVHCIAARDLRQIEIQGEGSSGPTVETKGYWAPCLEHVCFPWTEPDRPILNREEGVFEPSWRVIPPELCLKNRAADGIAVQVVAEGQGAFDLGPGVVYALHGGATLVAGLDGGSSFRLEGSAAEIWHGLLAGTPAEEVAEGLAVRADSPARDVGREVEDFLAELLERRLLIPKVGSI